MATRKRTSLTQRERECRRASREKAARMLVQSAWRRVRLVLLGLALIAVTGALAWEGMTGNISRAAHRTVQGMWQMTADSGFAVQTMYLEGRNRTPLAEVKQALGVHKGDPILSLSLAEIRQRLEALPAVKHASVERALPNRLYVRLIERDPVALWQHGGKLSLIDDEGAVMSDLHLQDYQGLPLLIGDGAPAHVSEALALLAAHPEMAKEIVDVVRVSDRRWSVHLAGGVEVKLPEQGADAAWEHFVQMRSDHKLPEAFRVVDMRAADRIYIRIGSGTAKET